ncbi:amidase family protein [Pelagovum pacificum]|uniref:Amidase n=1 Tax=Pelagovum pacificum TaxID=2588711 RepID=A0A5C5GFC6_9RHOB|nr:amidase family protein [Pelagovum pacificum]QQA43400.1 hypothetical protein I8N54_02165 [Pelagovum pacificum]TNY33462.1 amidase [Pelagovum pacificum]
MNRALKVPALAVAIAGLLCQIAPAQTEVTVPRLRPLDFAPFEEALATRTGATEALEPLPGIPELQRRMDAGELTSEALVRHLIDRIRRHDEDLRTFLELNPEVLDEARRADAARAENGAIGPLHGIPVALKDNIATRGPLHTTAGAELMLDNVEPADARLVDRLRDAGAVILGKTNLSEWAGVLTMGPKIGGVSAVGGAGTNPFGDYPTGGSSSGSAGSVAADFAVVSVGSETSGSLIVPAAWHSVVAMKPSRDVVSGQGILPLLFNNDSAGPMARNVTDLALLLAAMDETDTDYAAALSSDALRGVTVGVLTADLLSPENEEPLGRIATTLAEAGALSVDADFPDPEHALALFPMLLAGGVRFDMAAAIAARRPDITSAQALFDYNAVDPDRRVPFGQQLLGTEIILGTGLERDRFEELADALTRAATGQLDEAFDKSGADVLFSIDNLHSQIYATAGYPAITVPLGARPTGMPVGVTLIGRGGADASLIGYAFAFEQASQLRLVPDLP